MITLGQSQIAKWQWKMFENRLIFDVVIWNLVVYFLDPLYINPMTLCSFTNMSLCASYIYTETDFRADHSTRAIKVIFLSRSVCWLVDYSKNYDVNDFWQSRNWEVEIGAKRFPSSLISRRVISVGTPRPPHFLSFQCYLTSGVTRNSGPLDKISRRAPLLSFPCPSPPIPFKGLPPKIFMLHTVYMQCTSSNFQMNRELNLSFKKLSGTLGPLHLGAPGLSLPCPPYCYAAVLNTAK